MQAWRLLLTKWASRSVHNIDQSVGRFTKKKSEGKKSTERNQKKKDLSDMLPPDAEWPWLSLLGTWGTHIHIHTHHTSTHVKDLSSGRVFPWGRIGGKARLLDARTLSLCGDSVNSKFKKRKTQRRCHTYLLAMYYCS